MSHQEPGAARGWLPTLDAHQQSTSATPTSEQDVANVAPSRTAPDSPVDWSAALESQFGLRASASGPDAAALAAENAELRDRLTWYEQFDSLIRDNIARSAELFQALFTEREKARSVQNDVEALMNAVAAEAERRSALERQHMQHILMSLMDEARFLQQRSDALVQRVAEAITEMTAFRDEEDEPVSGA